jgi:hypothetical protein
VQERIDQIAAEDPGAYFALGTEDHRVVTQIDTTDCAAH